MEGRLEGEGGLVEGNWGEGRKGGKRVGGGKDSGVCTESLSCPHL